MFSFCVIRSPRGETAFSFLVFAVYVSAGDAMNTTRCSEELCPAQSMALWGALGVPLYCYHTGGSRHLPVGLMKGNVKAHSPDSGPESPSLPPPRIILPMTTLILGFSLFLQQRRFHRAQKGQCGLVAVISLS